MELKRCNNGHYYDQTKHSSCPFCGVDINLNAVTGYKNNNGNNIPVTEPLSKGNVTVAKNVSRPKAGNKTVALYNKKIGMDPVVGWLVCVEGEDKGRDYRIRSGRNFIGRADNMDICIAGDPSISRDKHAIVIYDPKTKKFLLQPGQSREMVYLNDEGVYTVTPIKSRDIIEMGETKLVIIPFCGEEFQWDQKQE